MLDILVSYAGSFTAYQTGVAEAIPLTVEAGFPVNQEYEDFECLTKAVEIDSPGYLYVYVSNHTPNTKVYFDDLSVTLEKDVVTQATDYYSFGGAARRANT
mgnify:CR=1 FL=1